MQTRFPGATPISRSVIGGLLAIAAVMFVFSPFASVKFVALGMGAWGMVEWSGGSARQMIFSLACAFAYGAAFLLTPFSAFLWSGAHVVWVQMGLAGIGALWVGMACSGKNRETTSPRPVLLLAPLCGLILLAALFQSTWGADPSYGRDEHYHMASVTVCYEMARQLLAHPLAIALLLAWIGAGAWLVWRSKTFQGQRVWWIWAALGVVLAGCLSPWLYSSAALQDEFVRERAFRYPSAQPWLSGVMAGVCFESWWCDWPFSFELLRMLPLLSVAAIGLILTRSSSSKGKPWWWAAGALVVVATIPSLRYYGDVLYLELPAVALLVLILVQGRRWLLAGYPRLRNQRCWRAVALLGFVKDTSMVAAGLLWLAREATRGFLLFQRAARGRRVDWIKWAREELAVTVTTLAPALLYMLLRTQMERRPYALHFENVAHANLWMDSALSLWNQFGPIWFVALVGLVVAARGRRGMLLPSAVLFIGIWVFHFLEDPQWIGLARFNLLLLPPVLWLGWRGMMAIWTWNRLARAAAILLLLIGNIWLSPMDQHGQKTVWGKSGELWYPWTRCLEEIQQAKPQARILIANMASPYGIGLVMERLGWQTAVKQVRPDPALDDRENLRRALKQGMDGGFDAVIFRADLGKELRDEEGTAGWTRAGEFASGSGKLILYWR